MRLLARHRFAFENLSDIFLSHKIINNLICFFAITCPMHNESIFCSILFKTFKESIKLRESFLFNRSSLLTQSLPICVARSDKILTIPFKGVHYTLKVSAELFVIEFGMDDIGMFLMAHNYAPNPILWAKKS